MSSELLQDTPNAQQPTRNLQHYPVRVITFDLDNTLWKTSATIAAANDALAEFLDAHSIVQPKRIEKIMGELFRASKETYCPIEPESAKAPVLLTQLRKDAVVQILIHDNGYSKQEAEAFAHQAFDKVRISVDDVVRGVHHGRKAMILRWSTLFFGFSQMLLFVAEILPPIHDNLKKKKKTPTNGTSGWKHDTMLSHPIMPPMFCKYFNNYRLLLLRILMYWLVPLPMATRIHAIYQNYKRILIFVSMPNPWVSPNRTHGSIKKPSNTW
jgi:hypothetical protein